MRQVVILGRQTHEVGTSVLVASFPIPVRSSFRVIKKEAAHQREQLCGLPIPDDVSSRRYKFRVSLFLDTGAKINKLSFFTKFFTKTIYNL